MWGPLQASQPRDWCGEGQTSALRALLPQAAQPRGCTCALLPLCGNVGQMGRRRRKVGPLSPEIAEEVVSAAP